MVVTMKTLTIPKKAHEKWAWIIYQLALRGLSLSTIARDLGTTRQAVYRAAKEPRPRMESNIAARLGLTPCRIWPERYPACGKICLHNTEPGQAPQ